MERNVRLRRVAISGESESGQALALAVGFLVFAGLVVGAVAAFVSTSIRSRSTLDVVRNRQYAAEAAVDYTIAQVRAQGENAGLAVCDATNNRSYVVAPTINAISIRVDCTNAVSTLLLSGKLYIQRNMVFAACLDTGSACGGNVLLRAQVNFQVPSGATQATRTYVQSWSVNK